MQDAEKLLSDVSKFIDDSRAILEKGDVLELNDLDSEVKRLCDAILQFSQDERMKYTDKLQALLTELSVLGEEMTRHRDDVAGQLHNMAGHRRAHVAYSTADSTEDKKKGDSQDGNG